jgi:hypothetical protein
MAVRLAEIDTFRRPARTGCLKSTRLGLGAKSSGYCLSNARIRRVGHKDFRQGPPLALAGFNTHYYPKTITGLSDLVDGISAATLSFGANKLELSEI